MEKIQDRFLRYVAVDTQSNEESESQPSEAKELELLKMLDAELKAMGVESTLDEFGYVMATIPSNINIAAPANTGKTAAENTDIAAPANTGIAAAENTGIQAPAATGIAAAENTGIQAPAATGIPSPADPGKTTPAGTIPTVGFIAHVDTAPDASGKDIKPQIIPNYDGSPIALKGVPDLFLDPAVFPEILNHKGETIITTDGTTLLGADDKAGVAEIMDAVQYITTHPEFPHGTIKIAFTPDEEIGRGVVKFDVKKFGADYAYTMDGGEVGELEFENFNAASATIRIQGCNVHPGYAKGKMLNAIHVAEELDSLLPADQRPEHTSGYEGFFHLISFKGSVEEAGITYIIRDHDRSKFEAKKAQMQSCVDFINGKYGEGTATATIKDQYYNMREQVEPHYHIIDKAVKAMEMAGIKPHIQPIRGGTDGANLSFKGLPCPNIFAGGLNFHGKFEWVPVESMEKASRVILNIISLFAE